MSNQMYNFLKNFTQIYLPAAGTLYFALAGIWGLPYGEQIVGTITAVDTFLGICLRITSDQYNAAINDDPANGLELEIDEITEEGGLYESDI